MNRNLLIAALLSLLLHAGLAFSGHLMPGKKAPAPAPETPTIAIELPPPPPEPAEPEPAAYATGEGAATGGDIAPPMQADLPGAIIDAPFIQPLQPPPPPGPERSASFNTLPVGPPRLATAGAGGGFSLSELDANPVPTFQAPPIYPFDLKRAGIEGEVRVSFIVDKAGKVRDPRILRSTNEGFNDAVLAGVLKWRFRPGQKRGVAVDTRDVEITIPFSLESER